MSLNKVLMGKFYIQFQSVFAYVAIQLFYAFFPSLKEIFFKSLQQSVDDDHRLTRHHTHTLYTTTAAAL